MKFVIDTNVVSELARVHSDAAVIDWVDSQAEMDLHLSAITVGELSFGLARMPAGQRRRDLGDRIDRLIGEVFRGRVLPYDAAAAKHFGVLAASRERQGRPMSMADAQIAAICLQWDATLVTRNVRDFIQGLPLVINPWGPSEFS